MISQSTYSDGSKVIPQFGLSNVLVFAMLLHTINTTNNSTALKILTMTEMTLAWHIGYTSPDS